MKLIASTFKAINRYKQRGVHARCLYEKACWCFTWNKFYAPIAL